ncbi:DUF2961 domain-containing protein [Paenibacillus sp. IB182496]|uniref:DUF2961 domain-containing protein n=1 Tax=Paenibacillus sabuli TaxID=2772509 RepID=A0A927BX45_9BACL|nr:DUF2961 domain-containing protein [Paenibacillus sabuli]MBD2847355.1 DUF2961 domain-containing protein [Paenibacillus sabuli]
MSTAQTIDTASPVTMTDFLEALDDPRRMELLWPVARTVMDSSLNQKTGPRDCNFFLRTEKAAGVEWNVLVDYKGPGCITRFWTAGDFDGALEIYLDGAEEPLLRTELNRFFAGADAPFAKPLMLDHPESSGGRVSYWPIPFAHGCKIRIASQSGSMYWQINALLLDAGIKAESLSLPLGQEQEAAAQRIGAAWRQAGAPSTESLSWRQAELAPRAETELEAFDAPGTLLALRVEADEPDSLQRLRLKIYWDGAGEAAVDVPLLHLFCQGSKARDFSSRYAAREGNTLTFAMPMPYGAGTSIRVENRSPRQPASLRYSLRAEQGEPQTRLRLHCQYRHEVLPFGTTYQMLNVRGSGLFVGMNQVMAQLGQPKVMHFHQEGNEYMYVDQYMTPSWLGTGTEDYYNCGYYYREGELATPTHGCLDLRDEQHGNALRGLVSAYRFHLLDAVPFRKSLLLLQEAGCPKKGALANVNGKEMLDYQWTCYWYEQQEDAAESSESAESAKEMSLTE